MSECYVGTRIPEAEKEAMLARIRSSKTWMNVSDYLRSLIRKDLEMSKNEER